MNSPHQREQLPDLLCDALNDAERARVESHLAQCAQCARELRALEAMQQSVASLPAATPPESVRMNVRAALRKDKKQLWSLSALLTQRAQERRRARAASATWRPIKNSERIGARKALPFALPARQLAWGGAVALGAVGLMLLARPSLQNNSDSQLAPASEAELASRATSGNSATDSTNAANARGTKTSEPKTKQNAKSSQFPAALAPATGGATGSATGSATGELDSVANLPPLPSLPPPPRARTEHPENMAPIPEMQTPSIDLFPDVAPAPKSDASNSQKRPDAPAPLAKAPLAKAPPARVTAPDPTKPDIQNEAPPAPAPAQVPAQVPPGQAPASPSTSDAENLNSSADSSYAPTNDAPGESAPSAFAPSGPSARVNRVAPAAQQPISSENWTGGEVLAKLRMSGNQAPVLTLGVTKAIGDARLFLLLPEGKTPVWRGSMNAAPIEIKLPNLAAKLRSGQKIRAKLEQTDSSGNPKGSTTFNLLWP